jgi:hypothetical protein
MSNPSDILKQQTIEGSILVQQGGGGTLFADAVDAGSMLFSERAIKQDKARAVFNQRVRGKHEPVPGVTCSCPMATKERGKDTGFCVVCGGEA